MIKILCTDILAADPDIYERLYAEASEERKSRADGCLQPADQLRCITADALLRKVLGSKDYQIEKNPYGKPYVADRKGFFFSISHSGRYAVIAWGNSEVGVDIQRQDAAVNAAAISKRFFAPDEQNLIHREPHRFFEIWTKKESYLKYTGKGLCQNLASFSVLAPAPEIRYLHWTVNGGYSLSLCTTDDECTLELVDARQLLSGE